MILMHVHKVTMDNQSLTHTVLLQDDSGVYKLVLPLGALEAMMLTFGLTSEPLSFPFIHEIMLENLAICGANLISVSLDIVEEDTFTAKIIIQHNTKQVSYLCKPTDAMLIALKNKIPIHVCKNIIEALHNQEISQIDTNKLAALKADDIASDMLHASADALWNRALFPVNIKLKKAIRVMSNNQMQTKKDKKMTELLLKLSPESIRKM